MEGLPEKSNQRKLANPISVIKKTLVDKPLDKAILYHHPEGTIRHPRNGDSGKEMRNVELKWIVHQLRQPNPVYRQAAFFLSLNGIGIRVTLTKSDGTTNVALGIVGKGISDVLKEFFEKFKHELAHLVNSVDFELRVSSHQEHRPDAIGSSYSKVLRQINLQDQPQEGENHTNYVNYETFEDTGLGKSPNVVSLVTTIREHAVGTLTNKTTVFMPKLPDSYHSAVLKLLQEQTPLQQVALRQEDMPRSSKIPLELDTHDESDGPNRKEDVIYMFDLKPGETNEEETKRLIREFDLLKKGVQNMNKFLGVLRGSTKVAKTAVAVGKVTKAVAPGAPLGPADVLLGAILAAFNWGMAAYNMIHSAVPFIKSNLEEGAGGTGDDIRQKVRILKAKTKKLWAKRFKGMTSEQADKRLADEDLAHAAQAFKSKESLHKYLSTRTIEELMILPKELVLLMNYLGFINIPTLNLLQVYNYISEADINAFRPPKDVPRRSYGSLLGETPEESDEVEKQLQEKWALADGDKSEQKGSTESSEEKPIGAEVWMYHPGIREEDQDDFEDLGWAIFLSQTIGIEPVTTITILSLAAITVAVIGATGLIASKVLPGMVERFYLKHGGIGDVVKRSFGKAKKIGKTVLLRLKGKNKEEIKQIFSQELETKIKKLDGIQASKALANITDISLFLNFEPSYLEKLIERETLTPTQYNALIEKLPQLKKIDVSSKIYNPEYVTIVNAKPSEYWKNNFAQFKNYAMRCVFSEPRLTQLLDDKVIIPADLSGVNCLGQFLVRYTKYSKSKKKKEKKHGVTPKPAGTTTKPTATTNPQPTGTAGSATAGGSSGGSGGGPAKTSPQTTPEETTDDETLDEPATKTVASPYPKGPSGSYDWAYSTSKQFSDYLVDSPKMFDEKKRLDNGSENLKYHLSDQSQIHQRGYKGTVTVNVSKTSHGTTTNAMRFLLENSLTGSQISSYMLVHLNPDDRFHGRYRDFKSGYMDSHSSAVDGISRLFLEANSSNDCKDLENMVEFILQSVKTLGLQAIVPLHMKASAASMNRRCSEILVKKYGFKQNMHSLEEWVLREIPHNLQKRVILIPDRAYRERRFSRLEAKLRNGRGALSRG